MDFTLAKLAFCFCNIKMLGLKRSGGDVMVSGRDASISVRHVDALQLVGMLMRANYSTDATKANQ